MKRVAFILKVKEDRMEEYKEYHRNVWPEVNDALPAQRLEQLHALHAGRRHAVRLL